MSTSTVSSEQPQEAGPPPRPGWGLRVVRSPSLRVVGRRVATAIPVMLGVTALTFIIMAAMPGNAAQQLLGAEATQEQVAQLQAELGTDRPPVVRYFDWLGGAITGDLGTSLSSQQPVTDVLAERVPVTFQLIGYSFLISLVLAVPMALFAARKPNRIVDRITMVVSMGGLAIANYVFALLLVLIFAVNLGVMPAIGYTPMSEDFVGSIRSLTLPAFAIGFNLFCFYTRFLRGDLLEQMQGQDYIVTAQAKGIGPWQVLLRHAFRNSLFGLLTLLGLNLGTLIGATVIIEQIFALPGMGALLLQSINNRDIIVVQACVLIFALVVVLANLVTDLLYAVLDPRIRYGQR